MRAYKSSYSKKQKEILKTHKWIKIWQKPNNEQVSNECNLHTEHKSTDSIEK
jgi:hypothetical protein